MSVRNLATHPAADIFPVMTDDEFRALVEDIRRHGQLDPIVLLGGAILDGRHRYRACCEIGLEPIAVEWAGPIPSPVGFVISRNLHRRHLSTGQRSLIAARLANMPRGGDRTSKVENHTLENRNEKITQQEAADIMRVGRASVADAKTILGGGTPEQIEAVETGEANVTTVARSIRATRNGTVVALPIPAPGGPAPAPPSITRRIKLPEGRTAEDVAREAVRMREDRISLAKIAGQLGVRAVNIPLMMDIVMIADRTDLSAREAERAAVAVADMNRGVHPEVAFAGVRDIARRLWGDGDRTAHTRGAMETQRAQQFERAIGMIVQSGLNAGRVEVPHMSPARAAGLRLELNAAIAGMRTLQKRLAEIEK